MSVIKSNFESEVSVAQTQNAGVSIQQAGARSNSEAAVFMAKNYPRNKKAAIERIVAECQQRALAEKAMYTYSRGGQNVSGPSIRLAEAMAREWGNIRFGSTELSRSDGQSVIYSWAWDVETNSFDERSFIVQHSTDLRNGSTKKITSSRDIKEHVTNYAMRDKRACILSLLPLDVVETAVSTCEKTLVASADTSPSAVKKMLDMFANFGVTREMIEGRIQRSVEAIQPSQIVALRSIYNSLNDGMSEPSNWFNVPEKSHKNVILSATKNNIIKESEGK